MEILKKAIEFENKKFSFKTTSDRIVAAREAKDIILAVNEVYKKDKDSDLMDLMKRLTVIKQKIEKRLKGRPLTAS
jgi:UDP-N-acetyl-D-mannosaminuronate dehydrogenase